MKSGTKTSSRKTARKTRAPAGSKVKRVAASKRAPKASPSRPSPSRRLPAKQNREAALRRIIDGLSGNDYTFISAALSARDLERRVAAYDDGRSELFNTFFRLGIASTDVPALLKHFMKKVVSFDAEQADSGELTALRQQMMSMFPLCAISFSRLYGPRFVAIVNGDSLSKQELAATVQRFQEVNALMLRLSDRLAVRVFGKTFGVNSSGATGSLILLAEKQQQITALRRWAGALTLRSDTILNQLKERFTSLRFWAKAAVGIIEYSAQQLRQEVIVVDTNLRHATSTASPRLPFEFGFNLGAIT